MADTIADGWGGDGTARTFVGLKHGEIFEDDGIVRGQGDGLGDGQ